MVREAVSRTYTYYDAGGDARIIENATLAGNGIAWVEGAYNPPVYPSPLSVRVGDAGIKVWIIMKWLGFYKDDIDKVLAAYSSTVSRKDVEAAVSYYQENKQTIDEKLEAEQDAG